MEEIIIAVLWFVFLGGLANILQFRFSITYQKNWPVFTFLFLGVGVPGIALTTSLLSFPAIYSFQGICLSIVAIASFVMFGSWWGSQYRIFDMYAYQTLKESYYQLLIPNAASSISKVSEIIIQDIVMLVIVSQLLAYDVSFLIAGVIFAAVVFVIHIPAPIITGKVYGTITMFTATIIAFLVPFVVSVLPFGFYLIFVLHLLFYAGLLVWSRWMCIRKQI